MSTFSCPLVQVKSVDEHPNANRLNLVTLEGLAYVCISGKLEDGSPRYKAGDWVVYIPSSAVLPENILREMDFWDKEKNKGTLAGTDGNRVKPLRLRGIFSEGVLYPAQVTENTEGLLGDQDHFVKYWKICAGEMGSIVLQIYHADDQPMIAGYDMSTVLGITKYEPPIPVHMSGQVANLIDHTVRYDFERIESVPDIFDPGEEVVATEKLHGTLMSIVYVPGLNHPEMFGSNGEIIVHSKGLGAQGLAFKNVPENDGNLYVRTLKHLLDNGLEDGLREASRYHTLEDGWKNGKVAVLGEIFGKGVQDLHYGTDKPTFRTFDIHHEMMGYMNPEIFCKVAEGLGLTTVPELYRGPFDKEALEQHRDGITTVGGTNIREGIVIRSLKGDRHPAHGRKIAKMISHDYLIRKSKEATEYQ